MSAQRAAFDVGADLCDLCSDGGSSVGAPRAPLAPRPGATDGPAARNPGPGGREPAARAALSLQKIGKGFGSDGRPTTGTRGARRRPPSLPASPRTGPGAGRGPRDGRHTCWKRRSGAWLAMQTNGWLGPGDARGAAGGCRGPGMRRARLEIFLERNFFSIFSRTENGRGGARECTATGGGGMADTPPRPPGRDPAAETRKGRRNSEGRAKLRRAAEAPKGGLNSEAPKPRGGRPPELPLARRALARDSGPAPQGRRRAPGPSGPPAGA